ncbi:MAG: PASTA domain-containing protein [Pyrinomonadaceae bacterium]|nr:PASTA domain-containing protein [Pyrinomonadaceae bacterium]
MSLIRRAWSAFGRLGIIIAIALAFIFGMTGTVYLSLRSPEVKVPSILGKSRQEAEDELSRAGLNMRVRATRYSADTKPDTVLLQLPHPGEVVKTGQTVAVDISRAQAKEGESSTSVATEKKQEGGEKAEGGNQNEGQGNTAASTANNQNATQNQNNRNKNKNKNANNANNSNNRNANNSNNRNNSNGNANRPVNLNNRNTANTTTNSNRPATNANANRRPPGTTTPFNPGSNSRP